VTFPRELAVIRSLQTQGHQEIIKTLLEKLAAKLSRFCVTKEPLANMNRELRAVTQKITKLDQFLQAHIQSKTSMRILKFLEVYET